MYRVLAAPTPRRRAFYANFAKNAVKTRVSEGSRDKKRVKYDTFSPPDQKSAIHSPNFLQIWRMYRVFAAPTPRSRVFYAHFAKNAVKTRVSEGSRDKKHVKYDTLSPPDQKSAIHSPTLQKIW